MILDKTGLMVIAFKIAVQNRQLDVAKLDSVNDMRPDCSYL